jgi:hypothetical protein
MDQLNFNFAGCAALAAVALLGYIVGRSNLKKAPPETVPSHPELKRARTIIRDLDRILSRTKQAWRGLRSSSNR